MLKLEREVSEYIGGEEGEGRLRRARIILLFYLARVINQV